MSSSTAIGIHLGSSFACVGVVKNGAVEIVANDLGDRTTAVLVAYDDATADAKPLVGRALAARAHASRFKARMGEEGATLQAGAREATPEELSAAVIAKLRDTAATYVGADVKEAVIAVPASFSEEARAATRRAAERAGLTVLRVLSEPAAAALAYRLDQADHHGREHAPTLGGDASDDDEADDVESDENVVVLRCGAASTDVTVLRRSDGLFRTLGHASAAVGGNDLDARMVAHFSAEFERKGGEPLAGNERALERLRLACERAKRTLSSSSKTHVQVDSLAGGRDFFGEITRARFEMAAAGVVRGLAAPVDTALAEAGLTRRDVTRVLLVGGTCKTPKVASVTRGLFADTEARVQNECNEDEAVAFGCALQAHLLQRGPACESPEAAAGGAALPVTALSLGVRAAGGVFATVVPRGTPVPCRRTRVFTSSADGQTEAGVEVVEGERALADGARVLGRFAAPLRRAGAARGAAEVEVAFDIDAAGAVTVSAGGVRLQLAGAATGEAEVRAELERAAKEADADAAARRRASVRAALESLTFALRNARHTERLPAAERGTLSKAVDESARWIEANPEAGADDLQAHLDAIVEEVAPLLKRLYGAGGDEAAEEKKAAAAAEEESEEEEEEESEEEESEEEEDSDLD